MHFCSFDQAIKSRTGMSADTIDSKYTQKRNIFACLGQDSLSGANDFMDCFLWLEKLSRI